MPSNLTVSYNAVNEEGTFSEGDILTGTVTLQLSKETKIQKLFVKCKGDANTHWSEKRGDRTYTYSAHKRYFKLKQFFASEESEENVLPEGIHVYKFSFTIPTESMPSSFKGTYGKIVYKLEAKLSRSWRMDSNAEQEIKFVSKSFLNIYSLMTDLRPSTKSAMSPIENLTLICDKEGAFSEGDTITGMVFFNLTKDTKVKSVVVQANGEAHVHWTEGSGDDETSYSAHRRYFKEKVFLVTESPKGNVLPKGIHQFKFSLTIPSGSMPSSFKGFYGRIVYMLVAKISRKWRWPSTVTKELSFLSKSIQNSRSVTPQSGSVNKKVGVFSKGDVHLSASVNRDVCSPGDTISAFAKICNSSSKSMKPKFSVVQRTVYRAGVSTKVSTNTLFKSVGDTIGANSEAITSCNIVIPTSAIYSIDNCDIITVDHLLKVYLDISFRIDPEVVLPLFIVPPNLTYPSEEAGPYPPGAFGGQSYSDFPVPLSPNPVPAGSGVCEYPAPVPNQPVNLASGFNEWPQDVPPYGFSAAAFTSPSIQHSAVPNNQQPEEQPPSYVSLFSPPGQ